MNAAIYFAPEAYTTASPKLMGRNAAGESFLRGYLAHSRATTFWAQVETSAHGHIFAEAVKAAGRSEPVKAVGREGLGALAEAGVVYHPGPGLGAHAWRRSFAGHGAWSLCGITHTTSSAGAMDAIAELLTAPVQPWDAVICTSAAVEGNLRRVLDAQAAYLRSRLGVRRLTLPRLPVIPLGVHTEDFAFTEGQRASARQALDADGNTLVVLFMGRLSFHAKAHPLAMYQALEKAARSLPSGRRVTLVECGWRANEWIAEAYASAARAFCPGVRVVTLDGRNPGDRQTAWAGADIFCSLSDNIQETFGITPIEAMAAGLPVVVSDWNGYKDTVRDGVDGFRIPTLAPGPGLGRDLALRHALEIDSYDVYIGRAAALIAVDVEAAAEAFARLFASPELRRRMGDKGRERARQTYDWAQIIPRYEALWASLDERRRSQAPALKPLRHPWPARMDPFHAFEHYPTTALSPQTELALADDDATAALAGLARRQRLAMVNYAAAILPAEAELGRLIEAAAAGPAPAGALVRSVAPPRQAFVLRALAWLVKLGVLKMTARPEVSAPPAPWPSPGGSGAPAA